MVRAMSGKSVRVRRVCREVFFLLGRHLQCSDQDYVFLRFMKVM